MLFVFQTMTADDYQKRQYYHVLFLLHINSQQKLHHQVTSYQYVIIDINGAITVFMADSSADESTDRLEM